MSTSGGSEKQAGERFVIHGDLDLSNLYVEHGTIVEYPAGAAPRFLRPEDIDFGEDSDFGHPSVASGECFTPHHAARDACVGCGWDLETHRDGGVDLPCDLPGDSVLWDEDEEHIYASKSLLLPMEDDDV